MTVHHVLAAELSGLAKPDAGPCEQVDSGLVAVGHVPGELLDLVDSQGGPLGVPARSGVAYRRPLAVNEWRNWSPRPAYHSRTTAGLTSPIISDLIRGSMWRFQADR